MAMDNMSVRKKQLEQLDEFVHTLYKETQTFKNYGVDLPDLEMLYLHIHELIQELLQAKTSDEFMAMIEELHKAVAGVLIVIAPANAGQVAKDMQQAHQNFDVDQFLKDLQAKGPMKTKTNASDDQDDEPEEERSKEELEQDKDDLLDTLDLKEHVKKAPKQNKETLKTSHDDNDPLEELWNS